MRFFAFSPLDYSAEQAFQLAERHLLDNHIVHVKPTGPEIIPPVSGMRPRALPGTYLVRIEQDNSLRVVDRALD